MTIAMYIFAGLAVALHVFIFYLESFAWSGRARGVFGHTVEQAAQTKELAFNMGFYNLFLALITLAGLVVFGNDPTVGRALILAGLGSMLAAAVLLFVTSADKRGAAVKQGITPLLGLVCLALL